LESVYKSRIDRGPVVLMVASSVAIGFLFGYFAVVGNVGMVAVTLPALLIGACLPLWLLTTTRYILSSTGLIVRSGPLRWDVRLERITHIERTSSHLAAPALSTDRLRIVYGPGQSIMISPRNREEFLRDLDARRPPSTSRGSPHVPEAAPSGGPGLHEDLNGGSACSGFAPDPTLPFLLLPVMA
jgi:hypothetical protein